jgi:hypothetical protein
MIGSEVLIRHNQRYQVLWQWREETVDRAMLQRWIASDYDGWTMHLSHSPNKRTLANFLAQAGGAEMLRLASNRLCDAGLIPSMLVHDGILFELDNDDQVRHAIEIMRQAGTDVCDGMEVGVSVEQMLIGGKEFSDKRPMAKKMWAVIKEVLVEIGALPRVAL